MKLSFSDKVYISLVELAYDTPLTPKEENRETTMQLVQQFQDDGLDEKHGFLLEFSGNVIKKYPRLPQETWKKWDEIYFSPARIKNRQEVNKKLKRL